MKYNLAHYTLHCYTICMTFLDAILLGILQGLTEFLPISSSGHLVLARHFLGLNEPLVLFDVMLHVGTLAAIIVVYRQSIARLLFDGVSNFVDINFFRNPIQKVRTSDDLKFLWLILLGSIPTGLIAVLFKSQLESFFDKVWLVSLMLIVTGIILQLPRLQKGYTDNNEALNKGLKSWHAPIIGIAQGCAITPGISRSGTTISLALFLGIPAKTAAEYSFLLSIPAILGAVVLKLRDIGDTTISYYILGSGMFASFLVGYIALRFLLVVLNRGQFSLFTYYCVALGFASLLVALIQ